MSVCRCGVDIKWVNVAGSDQRIPIESHPTEYVGPDRYRVVEFGERWTVEMIDPTEQAAGHIDHRKRCPR